MIYHCEAGFFCIRVIVGAHDLTVGSVYFPPQYVAGGVTPIAIKMWDYINGVFKYTPARSLPYIG